MANHLHDMLEDIQEQALERCLWITTALIDSQLGSDGRAFGDITPDRGERVARFIDMAQRGVIDQLQSISPPTYQKLVSEFERDVTALRNGTS